MVMKPDLTVTALENILCQKEFKVLSMDNPYN